MNIYYHGSFGRRVAQCVAAQAGDAVLVDLAGHDAEAIARHQHAGPAVVALSEPFNACCQTLGALFRGNGVTWTAVHLYPAMVRIGPLVRNDGICHECASRRYLAAPGSEGLARLEELLRSAGPAAALAFPDVPPTVVELAAAQALHQLADGDLPGGFIVKYDFVEHAMTSAVALPMHGCACAAQPGRGAPGERFHADLERDLMELAGGDTP